MKTHRKTGIVGRSLSGPGSYSKTSNRFSSMSRAFGLRWNRHSHISLQSQVSKPVCPGAWFSCPRQKNLRQLCSAQTRSEALHARTERSPEPGGLILALCCLSLCPWKLPVGNPWCRARAALDWKRKREHKAGSTGMCEDVCRR